jgi:hypothetical protein
MTHLTGAPLVVHVVNHFLPVLVVIRKLSKPISVCCNPSDSRHLGYETRRLGSEMGSAARKRIGCGEKFTRVLVARLRVNRARAYRTGRAIFR